MSRYSPISIAQGFSDASRPRSEWLRAVAEELVLRTDQSGDVIVSVGSPRQRFVEGEMAIRPAAAPRPPLRVRCRDRSAARDWAKRARDVLWLLSNRRVPIEDAEDDAPRPSSRPLIGFPRKANRPKPVSNKAVEIAGPLTSIQRGAVLRRGMMVAAARPTERYPTQQRISFPEPGYYFPDWYYGFNGETSVKIRYRSPDGARGFIRVGDARWRSATVPVDFRESTEWRNIDVPFATKVLFEDRLAGLDLHDDEELALFYALIDHMIESGQAGRSPDEYPSSLLVRSDHTVWDRCRYAEAISQMRIGVSGGGSVEIDWVWVTLNGHDLVKTAHFRDSPKTIRSGVEFDMNAYILLERLRQVGYYAEPQTDNSVTFAARRLGEFWSPLRPGYWPSEEEGGLRFFRSRPRNWCSEFAAWVIDSVYGLRNRDGIGMLDYLAANDTLEGKEKEINLSMIDMQRFFQSCLHNRWINANNCTYSEIGERVHPGFHVSVGGRGHSTIFIKWSDLAQHDDPFQKSIFHADGVNRFLSIGGNQEHGCVAITPFDISSIRDDAKTTVKWRLKRENYPDDLMDGFGDVN